MADSPSGFTFAECKAKLLSAENEAARLVLLEQLLAAYLPFIRVLAGSLLDRRQRSWIDSEDIRQSMSFRVFECLKDGRIQLLSEAEFKGLLRTMVRNLVNDKRRRPSPTPLSNAAPTDEGQPDPPDGADSPSREIAGAEAARFMLERLETTLQPDEFYCFQQHFLEGVEYVALAQQLGVSPDGIRMRLNRILAKVREMFPDWQRWLEE